MQQGVTPYPNKCNSTLTSGTKNIYPYPYIDVDERGSLVKSGVTGYKLSVPRHRRRQFCVTCEERHLPRFWVGMCPVEPKSVPITWAKCFVEKTPKTYKNDKNLLISLDLFKLQPVQKFQSLLSSRAKYSIVLFLRISGAKFSWFYLLPGGGTSISGLHWELLPPVTCNHIDWALNTSLFTANLQRAPGSTFFHFWTKCSPWESLKRWTAATRTFSCLHCI